MSGAHRIISILLDVPASVYAQDERAPVSKLSRCDSHVNKPAGEKPRAGGNRPSYETSMR